MVMIKKKIQKIVKEDGKEYIVETSLSGDTIVTKKETELVPYEYVDVFDDINPSWNTENDG